MIKQKNLLLLLLLLSSCSCNPYEKDNVVKTPASGVLAGNKEIEDKVENYCALSRSFYDDRQYYGDRCDGLLFTSLHGIACPNVSIDQFFVEGRPFRSPTHVCFLNGATSSVSRDMVIGATAYAWHHARLDIIKAMIEYGRNNSWNMCHNDYKSVEHRIGQCQVSPTLKALMYAVYSSLGGECDQECKDQVAFSQALDPKATGFKAHLGVLSVLIIGSVSGAVDDIHLQTLALYAKREPGNALYLAVYHLFKDGNMEQVDKLLKDEKVFPGKDLPTSKNYCTPYLFQRDMLANGEDETNPDWLPCPKEKRTHPGTDFLFAAIVRLGKFRHWMDE